MTVPTPRFASRLSLGDAVALFGLTPRALRFYEERGLVRAHRDQLNHRYYDAEARRQLAWIAVLRRAGVPLDAIARMLEAELEGEDIQRSAARALKAREQELEHKIAQVRDAIRSLAGDRPATAWARP
jgi:DNA-binding transcriptional MerR regulator